MRSRPARARASPTRSLILVARVGRERRELASGATDSAGVVRFDVPTGTPIVLLASDAERTAFEPLSEDQEDVTLTLKRGVTVEGRVVLESEAPAPLAKVTVASRNGTFAEVRPDKDGRFQAGPFPRGELWVFASAPGLLPDYARLPRHGELELTLHTARTVVGHVREGPQPVSKASVELTGGKKPLKAVTDAEGRFQFEGVRPGTFEVQAWANEKYGAEMTFVPNKPGLQKEPNLQLAAPQYVEARLRGVDGQPVVGASVQLMAQSWFRRRGTSGPDGIARLGPVPPGTFTANVYPQRHLEPRSQEARVDDQGQSTAVLEFELYPSAPLRGTIVDADGKPVAGAEVWASRDNKTGSPEEGTGVGNFDTRADGSFDVPNLSPGTYRVRVAHPDHRPLQLEVSVPATDLKLAFSKVFRVAGTVVDSNGKPQQGVQVTLKKTEEWEPDAPQAETGSQGEFELAAEAGTYRVQVGIGRGPFHAVLTSTPGELTLGPESPTPLVIRIAEAGSISGRVTDEDGVPVHDARVFAQPDSKSSLTRSSFTAADGSFALERLPEGRFQLVASKRGFRPARLEEVPAGAKSVTMKLEVDRAVRGRVVDEKRKPITDFIVHFEGLQTADGSFLVPMETSGEQKLVVRADGYAAKAITVVIREKGITSVGDILLERGRTLTGVVRDGSGQPVAGASLRLGEGLMAPVDEVKSAGDGSFALPCVPTERVVLHVENGRHLPLDLPVAPDAKTVAVALDSGARISGTFKGNDGRPLSGTAVFVYEVDREVRAVTDSKGSFALAGLKPGKAIVRTYIPGKPNPWSDWRQVLLTRNEEARIELSDDPKGAEIQVKLAEDGESGELVLAPGTPPTPRDHREMRSIGLDLWGSETYRSLRPVPPGTYTLFRWAMRGPFRAARQVIQVDARPLQEVEVRMPLPPASSAPKGAPEIFEEE
ncbi:MAG: carboxypeptidase-like regulatory domain-containing protein [Myxococcales bacterium]